jgi:UDP-N-acetylmuramate dehydrogenase
MSQALWTQLKNLFPEKVSFGAPLKQYTSFGIGGPADCLITVETVAELRKVLAVMNDYQQTFCLLGKGTNVLIYDRGIRGVVIRLAGEFTQAEVKGDELIAGAACPISLLLRLSIQHTLSGLAFAIGLPGSLGGAVYMNAGSTDVGIGSLVKEVHLLCPDGSYKIRSGENLHFSYRHSSLNPGEIITRIVLKLREGGRKEELLSKMKEGYAYRVKHQPLRQKSAGCIFKNPPGGSAGELIDLAGLKGFSIGDAQVSTIHANFFINRHQASCDQILRLMDLAQKKVNQFCGLALEPEVIIWGQSEDD